MKPPRFGHLPDSLGELLVQLHLISSVQLQQLDRVAAHSGKSLVVSLLEHALVDEQTLAMLLTQRLGLPTARLDDLQPDPEALREVPQHQATQHGIFPIALLQRGQMRLLRLAMTDPLDWQVLEEVAFFSGCEVEPQVAIFSEVNEAIRQAYRNATTRVMPRQALAEESDQDDGEENPLDESISTEPNVAIQRKSTLAHRVDALVALLVRKGLITLEEYETQLSEMVCPEDEEES